MSIRKIKSESYFDCDPEELFEKVIDIVGQYRALPSRSCECIIFSVTVSLRMLLMVIRT
jgi:hypothetical protein